MSEYSDQLVDHFTNPRNLGELEEPHVRAVVKNPVCGDQIHLFARLSEDRVTECTFLAYGCAASLATASILTETIRGLHIHEIAAINEERVIELAGGYTPSQMHCAHLAAEVLDTLVRHYREGTSMDAASAPRDCCAAD